RVDVAGEVLADADQLLLQRADPFPGRLVAVHTGVPKVPQRLLDPVPGGRVGAAHVDLPQRVVDPAVQRDVGGDLVEFLFGGVGRGAGVRVWVHLADQGGEVQHRAQGGDRLVVRVEPRLADQIAARDLRDAGAGGLDRRTGRGGELLRRGGGEVGGRGRHGAGCYPEPVSASAWASEGLRRYSCHSSRISGSLRRKKA